jgi:polyisoprenoid-binding protein YceI
LGCAHPEHDEKSLLPIGTAGAAMSQEHVRGSGYIAGTWDIDPVHSHVGFSARHLMVSKVRGNFTRLGGQIVTAGSPQKSSATATIGTGRSSS